MTDSNYTPTDTEVREVYRYHDDGNWVSGVGDKQAEEFDRWLAAHNARVWDEGFKAGQDSIDGYEIIPQINPYNSAEGGER